MSAETGPVATEPSPSNAGGGPRRPDPDAGLLEKLRAAKIKEFVSDAGRNPAEYGLDRPTAVTLGMGEDASRSTRTLRFGRAAPDKKGVYAQREGDTAVLLVEEELWKSIPASAVALRDKTVFSYDRGKLERVVSRRL